MLVGVLGDSTLDLIARPGAEIRPRGDISAGLALGPGGQGANVAVRLARRGVRVRLVSALGDDPAGRLLIAALAAEGIELVPLAAARTGMVLSLLDSNGERTMLSDRVAFGAEAVALAAAGAGWVHVSGYLLADPEFCDATAHHLGLLDPAVRVSIAGGSFAPDHGGAERLRARLRAADPDLLVVSLAEADALLSEPRGSPAPAAAALDAALPGRLVVVTDGSSGAAASGHGITLSLPAAEPSLMVVDATGAGDAYAAALIAALSASPWPPDRQTLRAAMADADRLGALVCGVVGAQGRVTGEAEPVP